MSEAASGGKCYLLLRWHWLAYKQWLVMQYHDLTRPQPQRSIRASLAITELNLERLTMRQHFHHGANLPAPQIVFRQINRQSYYIKQSDISRHIPPRYSSST